MDTKGEREAGEKMLYFPCFGLLPDTSMRPFDSRAKLRCILAWATSRGLQPRFGANGDSGTMWKGL